MKKSIILIFNLILILLPNTAFSQAASRLVDGNTVFYDTLNEAFAAASGISINEPDEITILDDIILHTSILIDTAKHIRLVSGNRNVTIWRYRENLDNPLLRVTGEGASLTLGKTEMLNELFIDGGRFLNPPIEAKSPLIAVNGLDAKVIMYDKVFIQNNHNTSNAVSASEYQSGGGVFIRSVSIVTEDQVRQPEFNMKGGMIRGNFNNTQNEIPMGGGVQITGFALFRMEGGEIAGNTAVLIGGGFSTGGRGSFRKTGGIIYGMDAPEHLQNKVTKGSGSPPIFGLAVMVPNAHTPNSIWHGRDTTVMEHENLTWTGAQAGVLGSFADNPEWTQNNYIQGGEPWVAQIYNHPEPEIITKGHSTVFVIVVAFASVILSAGLVFFIMLVQIKRRYILNVIPVDNGTQLTDLSPRENEIFTMLLTDTSPKEMSFKLNISNSAVNKHILNVYRKLQVQSRMELFTKYGKSS